MSRAASDLIVFHSWDATGTKRHLYTAPVEFTPDGPRMELEHGVAGEAAAVLPR